MFVAALFSQDIRWRLTLVVSTARAAGLVRVKYLAHAANDLLFRLVFALPFFPCFIF